MSNSQKMAGSTPPALPSRRTLRTIELFVDGLLDNDTSQDLFFVPILGRHPKAYRA